MILNFGQYMLQVAKRFGDKEALVNTERNRKISFMEFHLLTNKICNMMRDRFGLRFGDRYLTLLENDNLSLFHMFLMKGACTGAMTNYRDSLEEHLWQVDRINPRLVFIEKEILDQYYDVLRKRKIELICMDEPEHDRDGVHYLWDLIRGASDAETGVEYEIDEHFPLFRFTAGTTGKGKCAMYTAGNLLAGTLQFYAHPDNFLGESDRFLAAVPLSHGSVPWPLRLFFKGATLVTQNNPDLEKLCRNIERERITCTFIVPTLLYRLIDKKFSERYDLSSLRTLGYGSAAMSPNKLQLLKEEFGDIFVHVYAATEAFPGLTFLGKAEHVFSSDDGPNRLKSIGQPTLGVEIRIRDDEGNDVPVGEVGEIWIRSRSVIKGYYDNPEQTEKEFQDGFWKSGDMAYQDEQGYTYIVDRKKDVIITGGFNVYSVEVEEALSAHPAVLMSAVVGIPHDEWGEAVHAEVILREGAEASEKELCNFCREKIARHKAPKSVNFVNDLPLSVVGKVLRRKVREKYWKEVDRKI